MSFFVFVDRMFQGWGDYNREPAINGRPHRDDRRADAEPVR